MFSRRSRSLAGHRAVGRCASRRRSPVALASAAAAPAPRFYPDDPIQVDRDARVRRERGDADRRQQRLRLRRAHVPQAGRPARHPRGQRQHDGRGARLELVHQPDRTARDVDRRDRPRPELARHASTSTTGRSSATRRRASRPATASPIPSGRLYQIKFDPPGNPEMASGAEVIGAAIYHALGYNVVAGLRRRHRSGEDRHRAERDDRRHVGTPPPMRRADVDRLLARAARLPNGKYRATASRFADGIPLGYFKYYGTRPDDPERHPSARAPPRAARQPRVRRLAESRRLARAQQPRHARGARGGRAHIRHYMFDFGSIMGSGSVFAQVPRAGQRVHPRVDAGAENAGDPRPVRAALDPRGLSRGRAVGRPLRGGLLRSGRMAP